MKLLISDNVKTSVRNIFYYCKNISYKYANRTIEDILNTISSIKDFPYIGRYVPELESKYFRERICKGFRIIYFI